MKRYFYCQRCKKVHRVGECPSKTRKPKKADSIYNQEWKRLRDAFLKLNPKCSCGRDAIEVHHILPVKEYPELAYTWGNLKSVCKVCHARIHSTRKKKTIC